MPETHFECRDCFEFFDSFRSLQHHRRTKHPTGESSTSRRRKFAKLLPEEESEGSSHAGAFDVEVVILPEPASTVSVAATTLDELESAVGWRERGMSGAQVAQVKNDIRRQACLRKAGELCISNNCMKHDACKVVASHSD